MATQNEKFDYAFKVVLVGDNCVGKSSLHFHFIYKKFILDCQATIGSSYGFTRINIDGKVIGVHIWNTGI